MNLIDTPGHVDFHYEVSRSLACCEGAVLLVDAFQGVEAQTVANAYAAMHHDLTIVPVINKIDLTHARVDEVLEEMEHSLAIKPDEVIRGSGKSGIGCEDLLAAVIERVPPPTGDPNAVLQAMVFDSVYDEFRGAVTYVRIMNGTVRKGQRIKFLQAGTTHEVVELGQFTPRRVGRDELTAGQVGYLICNIKSLGNIHIGDTISVADGEPAPRSATKSRSGWSSAASIRPTARISSSSAKRSTNSRSTIPASNSSRKRATHWASVSAAASSACCTWRSSSSVWNRTPTSTWCRLRRTSRTRSRPYAAKS